MSKGGFEEKSRFNDTLKNTYNLYKLQLKVTSPLSFQVRFGMFRLFFCFFLFFWFLAFPDFNLLPVLMLPSSSEYLLSIASAYLCRVFCKVIRGKFETKHEYLIQSLADKHNFINRLYV